MLQPRKIILFSIILLSNLWGQWTNLNPVPNSSNLKSIFFDESGIGWVVGEDGILLKSTNDGVSWQRIDINNFYQFNKVFFINSNTGWIVGDEGIILKTTDGGKNWYRKHTEKLLNYYSLHFIDINNGVIVGENGCILLTSDGGENWYFNRDKSNSDLFDVKYSDAKNICATGKDSIILHSEDGGNSWENSVINWNEVPYSGNLSSLCFVNESVGWTVIGYHILKTTDKGKSWNRTSDLFWFDSIEFYSVEFIDENNGFIGGQRDNLKKNGNGNIITGRNSGMGAILKTSDGGESWLFDDSFVLEKVNSISFSNSKRIFAACNVGTIIYNNEYLGWAAALGGQTQGMESISFINDLEGWVAAKYYKVLDNHCLIYTTKDGGNTWFPKYDFEWVVPTKLLFKNGKQGWMTNLSEDILLTTDGGDEWLNINTGINDFLNDIIFVSETDGWAAGDNGTVIRSTDGGFSWSRQVTNTTSSLKSICFVNIKCGYAVGEGGVILNTFDCGDSWAHNYSAPSNLNSVTFVNEYVGWAVGDNGLILKSTDKGGSWQTEVSGTNDNLNSVSFHNEFVGKAVGDNGIILSTIDGGETWVLEQSNVLNNLNEIQIVSSDKAFVSGDGGAILCYSGLSVTGIELDSDIIESIPTQYTILQNYPNPFNPSTKIKFGLPENSKVTVDVFTLLGEKISNLVDNTLAAGYHEVEFNGNDLASGIYIYRIVSNSFTQTKKMMLLK
jgi:photosystem II stability/assembly factor-like uncharacterized protein